MKTGLNVRITLELENNIRMEARYGVGTKMKELRLVVWCIVNCGPVATDSRLCDWFGL